MALRKPKVKSRAPGCPPAELTFAGDFVWSEQDEAVGQWHKSQYLTRPGATLLSSRRMEALSIWLKEFSRSAVTRQRSSSAECICGCVSEFHPPAKRRCLPSFFQHCDRGIGDPGDDVEGSHELVTVLKDETFFEASRGCRQSKKHFPVLGKNVEPLLVNAGCLTSNSNRTLKMKNLPIHRLNIALPCG